MPIQPKGTVTYKGHRKTVAGEESFCKKQDVLDAAGKLFSDGTSKTTKQSVTANSDNKNSGDKK